MQNGFILKLKKSPSAKKSLVALCAVFALSSAAFAQQQITKFGVVDTARVYNAYFRNSAAVRNYERRRTEYQDEINRRTEELTTLQQQKNQYEEEGDEARALQIESEITQKTSYLRDYRDAKNLELANMQKELQDSNTFYQRLYDVLARIAERGGYSMILSLQQNNAILWYSSSVDVTDEVIAALGNE